MGAAQCCGSGVRKDGGGLEDSGVRDALCTRPAGAEGTFLRMISVNDSYIVDHYPRVAAAVLAAKSKAKELDCVVTSHMNGDFLSPCLLTSLDNGKTMCRALDVAQIGYACLGNHEFDLGDSGLRMLKQFSGTVVNSNASGSPLLKDMPEYVLLPVGSRHVVLAGMLLTDQDCFKPSALPQVTPIPEACLKVWGAAGAELGRQPDAFVPMTHQLIQDDRALAKTLGEEKELAGRVPVILGGHEHVVFMETAEQTDTAIVKVGLDAENIAVVDVWWTADGAMKSQHTLLASSVLPVEPRAQVFHEEKQKYLEECMSVALSTVLEDCSTKHVRERESKMATFLCQTVKRGLHRDGVRAVFMNGGGIRGSTDYKKGDNFTLGDLYKEIGFPTFLAIVRVPGKVLSDCIHFTRSPQGEKPAFLHADAGVVVNQEHRITHIDGAVFNEAETYTIATRLAFFQGMNDIQPLLTFNKTTHPALPHEEACPMFKDICVRVLVRDAWNSLLQVEIKDTDLDGEISLEERTQAVERFFNQVDSNNDGSISKEELQAYTGKHGSAVVQQLVVKMIEALDHNQDGKIDSEELLGLAA